MNDFSGLLRSYRRRAGLTQRQLADLSMLSIRGIRNLENGSVRHPRKETVRLLSDALRLGDLKRRDLETSAGCGAAKMGATSAIYAGFTVPPVPIDPIVGRDAEARVLVDLLTGSSQRFVNVVGLAGVGKSRLAQEVARQLVGLEHMSVLWSSGDGNDSAIFDLDEMLIGGLRHEVLSENKPTLLVLDGPQNSAVIGDVIVETLRTCPTLQILVTTQEPYYMDGEYLFPLGPLSVPVHNYDGDPDLVAEIPSVRLLLSHLRRVRPTYDLQVEDMVDIVGICQRLDGVPAALRMGAQWSLAYSLQELHRRLLEESAFTDMSNMDQACREVQLSIHRATDRLLPRQRDLLCGLIELDASWSIHDAARHLGIKVEELTEDICKLLLCGLVRHFEDGKGSHFQVLTLVRERPQLHVAGYHSTKLPLNCRSVSGGTCRDGHPASTNVRAATKEFSQRSDAVGDCSSRCS